MQSKKAFLLAPFSIRDYPGAAQWSETKKKKTTLLDSLIFEPGQRQVLHKIIFCAAFLMFGNSLRKRGEWGSKSQAPRFAIFSHNLCLLLLHKKRRILDYLWQSKPGRVKDSLNTDGHLLPIWLHLLL